MAGPESIEEFLLAREQFGMRFGLERMRRLLDSLGRPQDAFPAVHVVGTNGKSSTTVMSAAALQAQGLSTGSFTSPHLVGFAERIEIDCRRIAPELFGAAGVRVLAAIEADDGDAEEQDRVTQFEAIAAIAFCAFAEAGVDVAVVEAGLGGRLDATNVLGDSRLQVLTSVGIDHTDYLGGTLEEIAREKVAVVRSGALLISGPLPEVARQVVNAAVDDRDARWIEVRGELARFNDLLGEFVRINASVAMAVADGMLGRLRADARFESDAAGSAIAALASGQGLRGRLEVAGGDPLEIRDSAHNPQAARALASAVDELAQGRRTTLLVAMLADKPVDETLAELLTMLGDDGAVVCTASTNPRSLAASELAERVRALAAPGVSVEEVSPPTAALKRARALAGRDGLLSVTGSNYLIGDLLRGPKARPGATL